MVQRSYVVSLRLKTSEFAAREVAEAVWFRANPHHSQLVQERLEKAGITVKVLQKYFVELVKAVAEFWNSNYDLDFQTVLKPHELRGMYLPLIYSVVLSSIGNITKGNYEYRIKAMADEKPDREFLIKTSATLESLRDIIKGDVAQIGNRAAQPQEATMLCILADVAEDGRTAEMLIRDGATVDKDLAGLGMLAGVSLVESAYSIMYTGVEEVNFRQLTDTLVDKNLMAIKKTAPEAVKKTAPNQE
jgi:hypothetical protein